MPFEIAFHTSLIASLGGTASGGWRAWESINLVWDCCFVVDIFFSFRTSFVDREGYTVSDGYLIAWHYLRSGFAIDLVGSFPLNFFLRSSSDDGAEVSGGAATRLNRNLRLLRIIKLNRLLRLSKLSKALKAFELVVRFHPSAMRLCKLLLLMILTCHWMGCTWWFVADLELTADGIDATPNDWQRARLHSGLDPSIRIRFGLDPDWTRMRSRLLWARDPSPALPCASSVHPQ